jgi:hypothetical protein
MFNYDMCGNEISARLQHFDCAKILGFGLEQGKQPSFYIYGDLQTAYGAYRAYPDEVWVVASENDMPEFEFTAHSLTSPGDDKLVGIKVKLGESQQLTVGEFARKYGIPSKLDYRDNVHCGFHDIVYGIILQRDKDEYNHTDGFWANIDLEEFNTCVYVGNDALIATVWDRDPDKVDAKCIVVEITSMPLDYSMWLPF